MAAVLHRVGQREASGADRADARQRHAQVDEHAHDADQDWRSGVLARVERVDEQIVDRGERQLGRVEEEDRRRSRRVGGLKSVALEDHRDERLRQYRHHRESWKHQEQHYFDAEHESVAVLGQRAACAGVQARKRWQDGERHGQADDAERILSDSRGIIH